MGNGKDLTNTEKQKITNLLNEGRFTLEISKELHRDHQMIKRVVENCCNLEKVTE